MKPNKEKVLAKYCIISSEPGMSIAFATKQERDEFHQDELELVAYHKSLQVKKYGKEVD